MKPGNPARPAKPTKAQDELFVLHVKTFVEAKPSHQRVMADNFLLALPTIDRWSRGRNLTGDLALRARIMGWIWTHNCKCECS